MNTVDTISIDGDPDRVFELAARIEQWPRLLPHYRGVTVLERGGDGNLVRMQCVRPFGEVAWPCRWLARQWVDAANRTIVYRHVGGPTKGMDVEWRVEGIGNATQATILHRLRVPIPVIGRVYSDLVVGPVFVRAIAGRTLRAIKQIVESEE